jgi:hypothetical protein
MESQEDSVPLVPASYEALRHDPSAFRTQLDCERAALALYVEADRYVLACQSSRGGESRRELLQARQQALRDAALAYAHARGWQPPAEWPPPSTGRRG